MHQTLPHGSTEYNIAACSAVQMIAKQRLISTENFTKSFLQNIINAIESKDTVAADSWLETLIEVIDVLPANVLLSDVLPLAVNKAHISKPVPARVSSCKILGAIASQCTATQVKKDLLPIVISLCQDVTGDVRASMCSELPKVAAVLGAETGKLLLNSIVDLANDEEDIVRGTVIEAIADMIPNFQPDVLKSTIIPLAKKLFFKSIQEEDQVLPVVALVYGKYCIGLKSSLNTQDKNWFVSRYIQMSRITGLKRKPDSYRTDDDDKEEENQRLASVRELCAYNFPAMVLFCTDLKPELIDAMYSVFQNLAGDSYFLVRRRIAFCFHEVMKAMPKWCSTLKSEFVKLLGDINEKVLCGIVGNVKAILMMFSENGKIGVDRVEASKEVGQALLACETTLSESLTWRLHEEFIKQLQIVPKCFPADFVYNNIVPVLLTRSNTVRVLPCRNAAVKTLLVIISDPSQEKHKLRMKNKILELCNSANFYSRMLFVTAIGFLITISPQDVKEMFFLNVIAMTEDKVPNIRLAVCKILPDLKVIASDPYDRKLIAAIESSIRKLAEEKDRDVLKQIQIMTKKMDDVDTRRGGYRVMVDTDDLNTKFAPVPLVDAPKAFGTLGPKGRPYGMERSSIGGPTLITKDASSVYSTRSAATVRSPGPAGKPEQSSNRPKYGTRRKFSVTLDKDDFIVDAGIPLNSATAKNKLPLQNLEPLGGGVTPSPISSKRNESCISSRPLTPATQNQLNNDNNNNNNNENDKHSSSLILENKSCVLKTNNNRKVNEKPSSLPVLSLKSLSDDLIKTKISSSVVADVQNVEINDYNEKPVRLSDLKKFNNKRYSVDVYNEKSTITDLTSVTDLKKSINKRHSLDVSSITNNTSAKSDKFNKTMDFNKRYSFCSDYKKDITKQLGVCNNNNSTTTNNNNNNAVNTKSVLSPKPACSDTTNTGVISKNQQRPQSCVFKNITEDKISNSKRSVSVENLPPKTNLRSASRLPVRSVEARSPKQKQ